MRGQRNRNCTSDFGVAVTLAVQKFGVAVTICLTNGRVEIDFLFRSGIKTCPIEVKSSGYRVHASLDWLVANRRKGLGAKYVVCPGDFEVDNGITYLPFYMAHCL